MINFKKVRVGDIIKKDSKFFWLGIITKLEEKTFTFVLITSNYYKGKTKVFTWRKQDVGLDFKILERP